MSNKIALALGAAFLGLLLFGCITSPPVATGAQVSMPNNKDFLLPTIYNNTTSDTYELYYVLPTHAWATVYAGNVVNSTISFQGSLDGVNFFELDTYSGNTSNIRYVTGKPIKYMRFVVTNWAQAANISAANATVHYVGVAG